ncbi:Ger(x)C family spore germination protein [Paenibacillus elgii]|uniref:Ger(x)C family spore germination protein n=1 Tax=Paenibacillus elgii TaxID=189691 RepID=UPI000FD87DE0|nr:Ger(x)C family spore germination protein [Paenibacillus elgii]NEN81304.1 Ger(x)C family spore germination protein [Paenibacillus elgii]
MRTARGLRVLSASLFLLSMTGCWDRVEIEDVGIVLGIGFDKSAKEITNQGNARPEGKQEKSRQISMTHHFAVPKQFAAKEKATAQKDYINVVSEGSLVFDIINGLSTRLSRKPSYEHLRIILISEEVARSFDLRNIINFLLRNPEARRSIRVLICEGNTRTAFEKKGIVTNPALKLRGMTDGYRTTLRMPSIMKLGEMSENLTKKSNFVIQWLSTAREETKVSGAAVIRGKDARMAGWLDEEETVGLNWLKEQKQRTGIIEGTDPKGGGKIVYEVRKIKRTIKPKHKDGRISFDVEIKTEGRLREDWVASDDAFKEEFIARAERAAEASIKTSMNKALVKMQKKLRLDVAGFGKRVQIEYPQVWGKVKENWDSTFSEAPVEVQVKARIVEFGTRGSKGG